MLPFPLSSFIYAKKYDTVPGKLYYQVKKVNALMVCHCLFCKTTTNFKSSVATPLLEMPHGYLCPGLTA